RRMSALFMGSGLTSLWRRLTKDFQTLNRIELSRPAVLANFDLIQSLNPGCAVIPVLKSNAYGHGLAQIAEILQARRFPYLAVDGYFEALRVRQLSRQPVLVMGWIHPANYRQMRCRDFAFVVSDPESVTALGQTGQMVRIHLEINTGMNRYGVAPGDLPGLIDLIKSFPNLKLEGVMSHLADADNTDNSYTNRQLDLFEAAVKRVQARGFRPALIHLAQTAGSTKVKPDWCNAVRLGIGLYGLNPLDPRDQHYPDLEGLRPALALVSTISKVVDLQKGDRVSYNGTFTAAGPTRLGVLPLGYYEGVDRVLGNRGWVKFGDDYLPIVGRVCMNHTMIDLLSSAAKLGDELSVMSPNPPDRNSVQNLCRQYDLFAYELLAGLSPDLRRVIV
ncbi:MAG TPA: alanine racemase, partial [Candidatus Saccharimonadales bacterium]|nr:alanine racemase [Candidatus Saccharimonadales bacterium]